MPPDKCITLISTNMDRHTANSTIHPAITAANAVISTPDILESLDSVDVQKIAVRTPIVSLLDEAAALLAEGNKIAVLTSGDPLFYSLGVSFLERFGPDRCVVYPGVTSMQHAAAKFGIPWGGMDAVSAHGRKGFLSLAHAVSRGGPVCLLTDRINSPGSAASFLLQRGVTNYTVHVASRLGCEEEFLWEGSLIDATDRRFSDPNLAFFLPDASLPAPRPLCSGQPESAYAHEGSCITKWPVRAAALAALRIEPHHVVWDIGSGSGSVAVEAASLAHRGHVLAVEREKGRVRNIEENRRRFGAANLDILHASAPECLGKEFTLPKGADICGDAIPSPDRIFIGGGLSGGANKAERLIDLAWEHLRPGGRIVASCVLMSDIHLAWKTLQKLNPDADMFLVQACCSAPLGRDMHLQALNPVFCIAAQKSL